MAPSDRMKTPTAKTALFDMPDAPQGGEKAMRAYRRTDLSLCSYNGPAWGSMLWTISSAATDPIPEALAVSLALRRLPPKGRAAYLDQVVQDFLHLGGIGDDGQHSHFRVAARTDQPIDLIHFSDQSHALPRYEGSGDGRARLVIVASHTCAQGRQPFRWERREPA